MLRLPIMTVFMFSILVFLSIQKYSVVLREFLEATKIDFWGTLLFRFFEEDQGPTSSIYVSTPKDLILTVCCQFHIPFSKLRKSTRKLIPFSKSAFK